MKIHRKWFALQLSIIKEDSKKLLTMKTINIFFIMNEKIQINLSLYVFVVCEQNRLFQMTRQELCPTVKAYRTHKVAKQKPVPVTVYDYYDQSKNYQSL